MSLGGVVVIAAFGFVSLPISVWSAVVVYDAMRGVVVVARQRAAPSAAALPLSVSVPACRLCSLLRRGVNAVDW